MPLDPAHSRSPPSHLLPLGCAGGAAIRHPAALADLPPRHAERRGGGLHPQRCHARARAIRAHAAHLGQGGCSQPGRPATGGALLARPGRPRRRGLRRRSRHGDQTRSMEHVLLTTRLVGLHMFKQASPWPCPLNRTLRKFSAVVLAQHYGDTAEIPRQRRQSQPERCPTRSGA